ncbi:MAG: phosphoserine aminotransferase [Myxococcales bacterium]
MGRKHIFNAGPGALPVPVLEQAQAELVDFRGKGLSVLEMSHRSSDFEGILGRANTALRELLAIPDTHEILWLQGGASGQFAQVPLNFLKPGQTAAYAVTGVWGQKAIKEAKLLGDAVVAASTEEGGFRRVPDPSELRVPPGAAYLHITTNNTIYGTQWRTIPDAGDVPLVADLSSDFLSRPVDVGRYALIYAGAQKNLGPAGVTIVIVRKDWVAQARTDIPVIWRYATHLKENSLYHTPPVFAIYLSGLVLDLLVAQGGLAAVEATNERKAQRLYGVIDGSQGFFRGHAEPGSRSRMNVTFRLPTEELEKELLAEASAAGMIGLKGHRSVGGMRASIYNAVPEASVEALADLMLDFARRRA